MFIRLRGRPDRLGANITTMIAQIVFAHKNNLSIKYNKNYIEGDDIWALITDMRINQNLLNSIFIQTLFEYIEIYNSQIIDSSEEEVEFFCTDYFEIICKATLDLKSDLVSYFRKHIYQTIIKIFNTKVQERSYEVPFDVNKTIVTHLRLDDTKHAPDYDGRVCAECFSRYLDSNRLATIRLDQEVKNSYGHHFNYQAPIPFQRVENLYFNILSQSPSYEQLAIVTSPNSIFQTNYSVYSSLDESYDLFLLCKAKEVILSRSTFSLSTLFFGEADNYHVPLWGHVPCFGLKTKFDFTSNINYVY